MGLLQHPVEEAHELINQNKIGHAIQVLRKACLLDPDTGHLRFELAATLGMAGRVSEATELYFDLYDDGFRQPVVLASLAASLFDEGRVPEAIMAGRAALSLDPKLLFARSNLLFSLSCVDNVDPLDLFEEHRRYGQILPAPIPCSGPRRPGKLRVGFLCAWFTLHPCGRFSLPVVQGLDRDRFEVHCYYAGSRTDTMTERFSRSSDHWHAVANLKDAELVALIREADLDILIELDGHTGGNRLLVVAAKPARQVMTWLGYFNTTGVSAVDFRIVDHITDPEPLSSQIHIERLLRLQPPFVVFSEPVSSPSVSALPASTSGHITFGAFGQVHKHSDSAVDAIARVVLSVVNSRLIIRASACCDPAVRAAVVKRFESRGVTPDRIDCGGAKNNYEYLSDHSLVDIMLDLFPFTGFTTTCESLWMGVPMVTLQGGTHRERVSSSFLTAAGYPELIATSVDRYLDIARRLASDIPRLAAIRAAMRRRILVSPLMDAAAFVKRFEDALLSVVADV